MRRKLSFPRDCLGYSEYSRLVPPGIPGITRETQNPTGIRYCCGIPARRSLMTVATTWKQKLAGQVREDWAREIDIYETQIELRKKGKIEEKLFAETRLRRGTYGQRYDNGQRHDGEKTQTLAFPSGKLSAAQLDVLSELAEEYSDQILHVTTRQDIQLHFIHIEDTPDIMRRLAAVGITTREACGNS